MENSTKIKAIIAVLERRIEILQKARASLMGRRDNTTDLDLEYYKGKQHAYEEAVELLKSSIESISVEL